MEKELFFERQSQKIKYSGLLAEKEYLGCLKGMMEWLEPREYLLRLICQIKLQVSELQESFLVTSNKIYRN